MDDKLMYAPDKNEQNTTSAEIVGWKCSFVSPNKNIRNVTIANERENISINYWVIKAARQILWKSKVTLSLKPFLRSLTAKE